LIGGQLEIMNGGSAAATTITFAGSGTLTLDRSSAFSGTIAGFAQPDLIDLADIAFGSSTTLGYTGGPVSGTLTVSDGVHTATLKLLGQYTAANFTLSADGHGGTVVSDPPVSSGGGLAPPH
jgi:autotransporter-associated beta strand protein